MKYLSRKHEKLVEALRKLPGVGRKTALRLAFFLLKEPQENVHELARAIKEAKDNIRFCTICGNITEKEICDVCTDSSRDNGVICVIEEPMDLYSLERADFYTGVYHVLGGALSPLDGIGPEDLRMNELIERVKLDEASELIEQARQSKDADYVKRMEGAIKLLEALRKRQ